MTVTSDLLSRPNSAWSYVARRAPWLILCTGLLVTFYFWQQARQVQHLKLTQTFEFQVAKIRTGIENRLDSNEQILHGVSGLFAASSQVNRQEFNSYVSSLQIERTHPGIQGIGFARTLAPQELGKHIDSLHREGFTNYQISPPGTRSQYSAIVFLEPFNWRNQRALGFDMYAEPVRQAAMVRARDTGKAALSGKVKLVQETEQDIQAGALLYVPVYRKHHLIDTPATRRAALIGWAYSPLRMQDLLNNLLTHDFPELKNRIGIALYDGEQTTPDAQMYVSPTQAPLAGALTHREQLEIAGRQWTLEAFSLPDFSSNHGEEDSHQIPLTGIAITLLLTALVATLQHGQKQARTALDKLARANLELNTIYNTSSIGIFMLDENGVIRHANQRLGEMFGLPAEQIIGTEYVSYLRPEDQASGRHNIQASFTGEMHSVDVERCYQRADGTPFWGYLSGRQLLDETGKTINLVGVIIDTSDRHAADERLRQSEKRYRTLTETMLDVAWTVDTENMHFTYCSPSVYLLRGYQAEELHAQSFATGFDAESAREMENIIWLRAAEFRDNEESPQRYYIDEIKQPCRDGGTVWTEVISNYYLDSESGHLCLRGVTRNINERKQIEEEKRIAAVAFESHESTVVTDHHGKIIQVNRAFTRLNGYEIAECIGQSLRILHSGRHDEAFYKHMWDSIKAHGFWQGEIWNRRKNGEISPQWLTITAVFDKHGKTTHFVGISFDLSERIAMESEMRNMAFYDALTGLANRRLLTDRLNHAFAKSSRKQNLGAVIYIDLDHFKELNDHLGHAEGDRLLTFVADRLSTNVREGDTVARLGGDEFVILLEDLSADNQQASQQARGIAEKLRLALNQPYILQGSMPDDWHCTPSIGIALFTDHRESMEALLSRADRALYEAKHAGRNTIRMDQSIPPLN